jgi:hypothetical protein
LRLDFVVARRGRFGRRRRRDWFAALDSRFFRIHRLSAGRRPPKIRKCR